LGVYSAHKLFHYPVNTKRKNKNALPLPTPELFNIPLYDNVTLQGYRWGKETDPKVLLVHGWSTTSKSMTHFANILLKNNYQVISYDAMRHGKSEKSFSDLSNWADSVQMAMKSIGEVECIVAHSFGGAAVTVASKLGLNTKKLALVAPIHDIGAVVDDFAKRLGISAEIIKKMRDYTWNHNKSNFEKYGKDWQDILRSDFHVPTLIQHDKDDREIPIKHSKLLCEKWTWAKLIPTEGLGHRKILDDDTVAQNILNFIQTGHNS